MAEEIKQGDTWLYSTLGGDGTLTSLLDDPPATVGGESVYFDDIPQEVAIGNKPVLLVKHMPNRWDEQLRGNAGIRIVTAIRLRITLLAIVRSYSALSTAASRVDELLDLQSSSSGNIFKMERLAPYYRTYIEDGLTYKEVGADWILEVSPYV